METIKREHIDARRGSARREARHAKGVTIPLPSPPSHLARIIAGPRVLSLPDAVHLRTAAWASTHGSGFAVLHRGLLGVLHLPLRAALETIGLHSTSPPYSNQGNAPLLSWHPADRTRSCVARRRRHDRVGCSGGSIRLTQSFAAARPSRGEWLCRMSRFALNMASQPHCLHDRRFFPLVKQPGG